MYTVQESKSIHLFHTYRRILAIVVRDVHTAVCLVECHILARVKEIRHVQVAAAGGHFPQGPQVYLFVVVEAAKAGVRLHAAVTFSFRVNLAN